ncbi:DUF2244 domain-containing protein [Methyloversatilis universalis]|uniref:DUF2244 domain-containing protein n=1 Tax=Methyloversatilis universalis TaxID=378211 RepID=UPI001E2BBD25|nr:DUF2244 domain-containing protein [Methyloversatilis universalis]
MSAVFSQSNGFSIVARRNCSLSPRALLVFFLVTAVLSLAIATAWAMVGVWWVFPFAGIEIGALGIAFVAFGRRVGDFERIHLDDDRLVVELCERDRVCRHEFVPAWARVETRRVGLGSEVVVRCRDHQIVVGRYLDEGDRELLARELSARLREKRF